MRYVGVRHTLVLYPQYDVARSDVSHLIILSWLLLPLAEQRCTWPLLNLPTLHHPLADELVAIPGAR